MSIPAPASRAAPSARAGVAAAVAAYVSWGLAPLFWRLLREVDSVEVLAHRVLWSAVLAFGLLTLRGPGLAALAPLRDRAARRSLAASTALIAVNWFLFIWAVANGRVTEVSLGYYANPLVNVLLGRVVLGERLALRQGVAVAIAGLGVLYFTVSLGTLPWISVVLALTFGVYGLVRKQAPLASLAGLAVETGLCAPLALGYLLVGVAPAGGALTTGDPGVVALLILSGPVTALPLLLFTAAARRLPYSALGMVQYLAPTLQLACATVVFGEPFTSAHAVTFGLIWTAVALYLFDAVARARPSS